MYRQTPCDLASSLGYEQCAQFLRSHGCATGNIVIRMHLGAKFSFSSELVLSVYMFTASFSKVLPTLINVAFMLPLLDTGEGWWGGLL